MLEIFLSHLSKTVSEIYNWLCSMYSKNLSNCSFSLYWRCGGNEAVLIRARVQLFGRKEEQEEEERVKIAEQYRVTSLAWM